MECGESGVENMGVPQSAQDMLFWLLLRPAIFADEE